MTLSSVIDSGTLYLTRESYRRLCDKTPYLVACDKRQGVDYTLTDLEVRFGPMNVSGKGLDTIDGIDNDYQEEPSSYPRFEGNARQYRRKWDNVKVRAERWTPRMKGRKRHVDSNKWGLSIKKTERPDGRATGSTTFSAVITLRSTDRRNHFNEFVQLYQGTQTQWLAHIVSQSVRQRVYQQSYQDIHFE